MRLTPCEPVEFNSVCERSAQIQLTARCHQGDIEDGLAKPEVIGKSVGSKDVYGLIRIEQSPSRLP